MNNIKAVLTLLVMFGLTGCPFIILPHTYKTAPHISGKVTSGSRPLINLPIGFSLKSSAEACNASLAKYQSNLDGLFEIPSKRALQMIFVLGPVDCRFDYYLCVIFPEGARRHWHFSHLGTCFGHPDIELWCNTEDTGAFEEAEENDSQSFCHIVGPPNLLPIRPSRWGNRPSDGSAE